MVGWRHGFAGQAHRLLAVLILTALAGGAVLAPPAALAATPGSWTGSGNMHDPRAWFTATLLLNGKVLAAGGYNWTAALSTASADIYDPGTGAWTLTDNLGAKRYCHQAVLLANGKVLVAGGYINGGYTPFPEELYDPAGAPGSRWSTTGALNTPRYTRHTLTVLADGTVLAVGGFGGPITSGLRTLNEAERYNPANGQWTPIAPMNAPRGDHTATLLPDGKVLVVGGEDDTLTPVAGAELYDPVHNVWSPAGTLSTPRQEHTATLLPDGRVLVTGGRAAGNTFATSAEIYNPASPVNAAFTLTATPNSGRCGHSATLLDNGKVLAVGGSVNTILGNCEIYAPAADGWSWTSNISNNGRWDHRAVRLRDGAVLVAGGYWVNQSNEYEGLASAEYYTPEAPPAVKLPPLVAFYPFDGNAQDASGNGLHAQVAGGAPQSVTGYQGQAYSFNGSSDYFTSPVDINPGRFPRLTMGCWAKQVSTSLGQQLITHDDGDFDRSLGIDTRGAASGWSAFCGPSGQVLGGMQGYLGTWTFLVVVYDQGAQTVKLMVDNQVISKSGVTLGPGQKQMVIGASTWFFGIPTDFFGGVMDNIFIFADALTEQQLAYVRSSGAPAILSAPRWHLARTAHLPLLLLD